MDALGTAASGENVASPLVTIAMPARNAGRTLALAPRSIVEQTYTHWEFLLMEDGSTDMTLRVARSFNDPRIRVLSDGRARGMTVRLNQAIQAAKGHYYARMDADDVAYPWRLECQLAYLQAHPNVDLVGAWVLVFDRMGKPLGKRDTPEDHAHICAHPHSGFPIAHPTYMGRLDWFRGYPYDEQIPDSQDEELLLRAYRTSRYANVPQILLGYREERLSLKKLIIYRRATMKHFFNYFRHNGQPLLAARSVVERVLKMLVDVVAVTSGLNYKLLRHRARGITDAERKEWEEIWKNLQQDDARLTND